MTQWSRGDLALCVKHGAWEQVAGDTPPNVMPVSGGVYTVRSVDRFCGYLWLWFEGLEGGYDARRFRRIAPLSDSERRQAVEDLNVLALLLLQRTPELLHGEMILPIKIAKPLRETWKWPRN